MGEDSIAMGRGSQEIVNKAILMKTEKNPGKEQLERQAMVREYVCKLAMVLMGHVATHGFCVVDNFLGAEAASLLLEEISVSNPYTNRESRGIKYLLNLLDSVVTLACRGARQRGHTDILTKVEGREGFITVGNPVPDQNTKTEGLTATIFLNKAWVVDTDGGELRLCPSATTLATIPPVFDRVVFYPPHLVSPTILPTTKNSLSCTVSYTV